MSDNDKQERVFKSMQLLGPECLNQWIRLRLPTNEGVWFWVADLSQINQERATGTVFRREFQRSSCPECTNRWIRLYLPTEKFISFFPVKYSFSVIDGLINTTDYVSAMCPPYAPIPTDLSGTWETTFGRMNLIQSSNITFGEYNIYGFYSTNGRISYATPWGYDLYGQWIVDGNVGRFKWTIAPDQKSFIGTFGNGDNFDGLGTWSGTKVGTVLNF